MSHRMLVLAIMVLCLLGTTIAHSVVPTAIPVQGRLTNAGGSPLAPGFKVLTFRIFDASSSGTQIWPAVGGEAQTISSSSEGLWVALVGALSPLNETVFVDTVRWLEVNVDDGVNPPVTMPRVRLATGAYAFRVGSVDGASGGAISSKLSIGPGTTNAGVNAFAAGVNNTASGNWSTVAGGTGNIADDTGSVVSGGGNNRSRGRYATVGGGGGSTIGDSNLASGDRSTIGGGVGNTAAGTGATVAGGLGNLASDYGAAIVGGLDNQATGFAAFVGGGMLNRARGAYSVVSGGGNFLESDSNAAVGIWSTIAGGKGNIVTGNSSSIGGGDFNRVTQPNSIVGGGILNEVSASSAVIGGGSSNRATNQFGTIGGGRLNDCTGEGATIGGGRNNDATGSYSTVAGGGSTAAGSGNFASGEYSMIPGGHDNQAAGRYSMAAGRSAKSDHNGCFVWADTTNAEFTSTGINQFLIRASGGVGIGTTSPEAPLHVFEGSAGTVTASVSSSAVFERDTHNYVCILGPDNMDRGVLFGSPLNAASGGIIFDPVGLDNGMQFRTNTNDTRMTLDASGNLNVTGNITATGSCCASDLRFKKNITPVNGALGIVEHLRGVRYEWRQDEHPNLTFNSGPSFGVIAQEVQDVLPELIREAADGYLAVDYNGLVPILIEAIKEQQKRIESLEHKLQQITP